MQRIIQINIAGRLIPIEEDAYMVLKDYLSALNRHFAAERGKDEIIQDIEGRIAELFLARLATGMPSIDGADVQKLIETLGTPYSMNNPEATIPNPYLPARAERGRQSDSATGYRRLYRNPDDKWLGGVCGGMGAYFDIDPVLVRFTFVLISFFMAGVLIYIIAWILVPIARTPEELTAAGARPYQPNFYTISRDLGADLKDLKARGEQMSRDLRDFFNRKK